MKYKSVLVLIVFVFCFPFLHNVDAQTPSLSTPNISISPYVGARSGFMLISETGFDNTIGGSLYGGVDFMDINLDLGEGISSFSIILGGEIELTSTLIAGDLTGGGDWEVIGLSGLGTATGKITDMLYIKSRLGLLLLSQEVGVFDSTDVGITGGVACGLNIGDYGAVEVDITGLANNLAYFNAGYRYNF